MPRQQECEFQQGDRVTFDVVGGRFKVTGYGTISRVRPDGAYTIQPDRVIAPGTQLENVKKVEPK